MAPLFLLATGLLIRGFLLEPRRVMFTHHRMQTAKLEENIRVVHLTDLHIDHDTRRDYVLAAINEQHPDLILMTGDYLNKPGASPRLSYFVQKLKSFHGIYASFGNWDAGMESFLFAGTQVIKLSDELIPLRIGNNTINMLGLNYPETRWGRAAVGRLPRNQFNILLHHSPDLIEHVAPSHTVDLYLSGHTHGGQIRIPLLKGIKNGFRGAGPYAGAVYVLSEYGTKYESGRYQVGNTTLYVNRGLGMEGGIVPRIRLFCPPEIAVFDIGPGVPLVNHSLTRRRGRRLGRHS